MPEAAHVGVHMREQFRHGLNTSTPTQAPFLGSMDVG